MSRISKIRKAAKKLNKRTTQWVPTQFAFETLENNFITVRPKNFIEQIIIGKDRFSG